VLPPFPIDDETLDLIELALGDARVTLTGVLDLLSGYDDAKTAPALNEYDQPIPDVHVYTGGPLYHPNDVIQALIAEVRSLRQECPR
jgi:hypothetical protein